MLFSVLLVALLCQINAGPVDDAEFAAYKLIHPEEFGDKFQGDIVLDGFRNGIVDQTMLWPGARVYYEIDRTYTRNEVANINAAIAQFTANTCVQWIRRTNQPNYVRIHKGNGCSSAVGMVSRGGEPQLLSLGAGCTGVGTIIHEMLHAIGFVHEQCRTDRDDHIIINWNNIQQAPQNMTYNFVKYGWDYISLLTTGYDYGSIMHYGPKAFSVNGQDTITPRERGAVIGQRNGFSALDIRRVMKLYCGVN